MLKSIRRAQTHTRKRDVICFARDLLKEFVYPQQPNNLNLFSELCGLGTIIVKSDAGRIYFNGNEWTMSQAPSQAWQFKGGCSSLWWFITRRQAGSSREVVGLTTKLFSCCLLNFVVLLFVVVVGVVVVVVVVVVGFSFSF